MTNAKERGVSSQTIGRTILSAEPAIKRLVGIEGNFGEQAELTKDWVVQIVREVGNNGEVFERNIGTETRLGIPPRARSPLPNVSLTPHPSAERRLKRLTLHTPPPGTKQRM
jgi:hypothetical protein